MREVDRPRGTMLRKIDGKRLSEAACAKVNAWLAEHAADAGETMVEMTPVYPPLAVSDTDAGLFVVCSEGVGWEVREDKPLTDVPFSARWTDREGKPYANTGGGSYNAFSLTAEEVRQLAKGGEEIDLADLVRSFGDRLENNFSLWHYRINEGSRT
jgi:hypothetical protein